jgi:hypothetical protein
MSRIRLPFEIPKTKGILSQNHKIKLFPHNYKIIQTPQLQIATLTVLEVLQNFHHFP